MSSVLNAGVQTSNASLFIILVLIIAHLVHRLARSLLTLREPLYNGSNSSAGIHSSE